MEKIRIPKSALPARGDYIRHVIESGHMPGILSGARLKGKARQYGGHYARQRVRACAIAREHGVEPGIVQRAKVWTVDGTPVELVID